MSPNNRSTVAVILAAGKGTRMKSEIPKVLHTLLGRPMLSYILEACRKAGVAKSLVVVGHGADRVRETLGPEYEYVEQTPQLGTGHALMTAAGSLTGFEGDILVLAGDTPLLTGRVLKKLIDRHKKTGAAATMMTAVLDPTPAYGRIIRDEEGRILRIVEDRDATRAEKRIKEVNTSHYCFAAEKTLPLLAALDSDNDQGEYYLTDVIHMLARRKEVVESIVSDDPHVLLGINSRTDLARVSRILQEKILNTWTAAGVTIHDSAGVTIEGGVRIGRDTKILGSVTLQGRTVIGRGCTIGPNVRLQDARIGDNAHVEFSVIENRKIEANAVIGPFAYITGKQG